MKKRFVGLDCLRGLAAITVLIAHYSSHFKKLYPAVPTFSWTLDMDYARSGVHLFFAISGFVILMTLDRIEKPLDFLKARFFRLYPPFWVAVTFTFSLLLFLSLPGRNSSWHSYAANLTMIPRTLSLKGLRFDYVDGVYWTLEREFFFYLLMAMVLALKLRRKILWIIVGLLVWSLILPKVTFIGEFWKSKLEIVTLADSVVWFALGISIYHWIMNRNRRMSIALIAFSAASICYSAEGPGAALAFIAIGSLVYASTYLQEIPRFLSPFVFLGTISYSLYLVHQNLGYVILRDMGVRNYNGELAFATAAGCSILMATALCYGVEKPVMAWYKRRSKSRAAVAK